MSYKLDGYVTVNERLAMALERWPDLRVVEASPKIVTVNDASFVEVTVTVWRTPDDTLPCTAAAWEPIPGKTPYTRDSEMMNCSTSALGRALGLMGIGTASSMASADEVIARDYDRAFDSTNVKRTKAKAAPTKPSEPSETPAGPNGAGKRQTPTEKMANFLRALQKRTGLDVDPAAFEDFDVCRSEIDRLQAGSDG